RDERASVIPEAEILALVIEMVALVENEGGGGLTIARADGAQDAAEPDSVMQTEVGIGLGDWTALGLIAVEQRRSPPAVEHRLDLPGQVVRVLDAGVHAEAARGGEAMRRVAG